MQKHTQQPVRMTVYCVEGVQKLVHTHTSSLLSLSISPLAGAGQRKLYKRKNAADICQKKKMKKSPRKKIKASHQKKKIIIFQLFIFSSSFSTSISTLNDQIP